MSKLTKKFIDNFTIVGNQFFDKLTMKEIAMYVYLLSKPDNWNLSKAGTSADTGWGETEVGSAIQGLIKKGLLTRNKYKNEKGQWDWSFELNNEIKQEKPLVENLSVDFPVIDNLGDINKKDKITKINNKDNNTSPHFSKEAKEILEYWNLKFDQKNKSILGFQSNLVYWLKEYNLDEIKQAIDKISDHDFWKDKMSLTTLFRKKNPNKEPVDYISELLNYKPRENFNLDFRTKQF